MLRIQNTGLVNVNAYILYDILPHLGDTGVSQATAGQLRDSQFRTFLTGPIVLEEQPEDPPGTPLGNFVIEYYIGTPAYNPARPEMSNSSDIVTNWSGGGTNFVLEAGVTDWNLVTAFRIRQDTGIIPPGGTLVFSVPMRIDDTAGEAETGEIAWNNFAQRFTNQPSGRRLLTAEPRKVGIIVDEKFSIGNRVWLDNGAGTPANANNGVLDAGEVGLDDVTVQLFSDEAVDGVFQLVATDVTRDGGYYFFGNLESQAVDVIPPDTEVVRFIEYQVRIPAFEFDETDPDGPDDVLNTADDPTLANFISSTGSTPTNTPIGPANDLDSTDTGIDPAAIAAYPTDGVRSQPFTLQRDSEALGETNVILGGTDPSPPTNEGPFGRGENFEEDPDSDLTVDFGFFRPMSLGNRVWLDTGAGGNFNNGVQDADEDGILGVTVQLFRDDNGDGVPDGAP
ncbi:MAG: hypothetical protein HC915_14390 [Anaerolineae bacterium]|nr:hypothetical protein [Anaerolineae bacterium]